MAEKMVGRDDTGIVVQVTYPEVGGDIHRKYCPPQYHAQQ